MRRAAIVLSLVSSVVSFPVVASAQALRFSATQPGDVVAVGNTLGLAKEASLNGPGISDAIGTFITLDGASVDTELPLGSLPWPAGTTNDWTLNGSAATLELPTESVVLYAELVWGGSHAYGGEDVTAFLDDPVTLTFGNDTIQVTPDAATATTIEQTGTFVIRYYMRSGDVTSFVEQHGAGSYEVNGVPGTQASGVNTVSAAGWSIIVAYRYDGEPIRNLSVFVGDTAFVDENTTVDYSVSGFCAPPAGSIEGTIAIATVEGDSNRVGDQLAIGQTVGSTFVNLSGPNNPSNNFFCSQINRPDGTLDTTGTFGSSNHTPGSNATGARQGWDLTHVQLSSAQGQLVPGQTSAVLRTQTLDDSYMPVMAGIAIDVNAPTFVYQASTTDVSTSQVELGDQIVVTATLVNEGSAQADDVSMTLPLPSGISLVDFQTNGQPGDINGASVDLGDLAAGVTMGDLPPGDDRIVTATVQIDAPQSASIFIQPVWSYEYVQCAGSPTSESFAGEVEIVTFVDPGTGGGGGGGTGQTSGTGTGTGGGSATGTGTGTASSMSTASSGDDGGEGGEGGGADKQLEADGCDCSVPTSGDSSGAAWALLALLALRRKKSR